MKTLIKIVEALAIYVPSFAFFLSEAFLKTVLQLCIFLTIVTYLADERFMIVAVALILPLWLTDILFAYLSIKMQQAWTQAGLASKKNNYTPFVVLFLMQLTIVGVSIGLFIWW